ncbi:hypothetical protein [Halorientalis halophila]|uniref:hypothetical protein n=1 Tax=Halorientalis halophila TaxID=3108499 RepID=UPI00300B02D3
MTDDDQGRSLEGDARAFSITDSVAAGALVVLAIVLAAGLGLGVLYAPSESADNETRANFTFQHFSDDSVLIVTFSEGDPIPAGELLLTSSGANVTWATVANTSETAEVSRGSTIQLGADGPFGRRVTTNTEVRVLWTGGNETRELDSWPTAEAEDGG